MLTDLLIASTTNTTREAFLVAGMVFLHILLLPSPAAAAKPELITVVKPEPFLRLVFSTDDLIYALFYARSPHSLFRSIAICTHSCHFYLMCLLLLIYLKKYR
jgi:hypothetical protein